MFNQSHVSSCGMTSVALFEGLTCILRIGVTGDACEAEGAKFFHDVDILKGKMCGNHKQSCRSTTTQNYDYFTLLGVCTIGPMQCYTALDLWAIR